MSNKKNPKEQRNIPVGEESQDDQTLHEESTVDETQSTQDPDAEPTESVDETLRLKEQVAALKDAHLRLMAEYDNYRKRTLKEKADLIKSGGERILSQLLEVLEDFDRALEHIDDNADPASTLQGVELIHKKLISTMNAQGVHEMEVLGEAFDPEIHEAVAMVPTEDPTQKGKVLDCVKKGYMLHDKVLRHPKVVVGQ